MLIAYTARVLLILLNVYLGLLFVRALMSWVPLFAPNWRPRGPILVIFEIIYTLTDPPLKFVSRVIRPVHIGSVGLDMGFLVVVLAIIVAQRVLVIFA